MKGLTLPIAVTACFLFVVILGMPPSFSVLHSGLWTTRMALGGLFVAFISQGVSAKAGQSGFGGGLFFFTVVLSSVLFLWATRILDGLMGTSIALMGADLVFTSLPVGVLSLLIYLLVSRRASRVHADAVGHVQS